jgi:hypothetical protein
VHIDLRVGNVRASVRDLEPEDEDAVLEVFTASEDWFVAETGQPSAPGDVQSCLYVLPEGNDFEDKVLALSGQLRTGWSVTTDHSGPN